MPNEVSIPRNGWVLVGDGRKALVLRNEGTPVQPRLTVEHVFNAPDNPPNRVQGSDRPTRVFESATTGRSAVEPTDWHEIEEARFARDVAAALGEAHRAGRFERLVVVAPPKTLAELRSTLDDAVRGAVVGELDKTYTNHPVPEIERLLAA